MTIAWPATVPTAALLNDSSYTEDGEDYVALTPVQVGPPQRRRRASVPSGLITFTTKMTFDEYDYFVDFYINTLLNGTLPCTRPHPRKYRETITCTIEKYPACGQPQDNNTFFVQIQIRNLSKVTTPPTSFNFSDTLNSGYEVLL